MPLIKKTIAFSLSLLLLAATLVGCAKVEPTPPPVGQAPKKVAVLFSSLAEIWLEAGGDIAITVGESVERGFAPAGTPLLDEGAGKTIHTELLLSLAPDLVICSADIPAQVEAARLAELAGIETLVLRVECFGDYLSALAQMCEKTGNHAALASRLTTKAEIDALLARTQASVAPAPSFLFVRAGSTASSTKPKQATDHFACAMIEEIGGVNIMSQAPVLLDGLNMEAILAANPQYIFFSMMGSEDAARANIEQLLASDTWQALDAVREGRVIILPKDLFHFKPNAHWGEAYAYLGNALGMRGGTRGDALGETS